MTARFRPSFLLLMALAVSGCDDAPRFTAAEPGESRSGGATTVNKSDRNAFSLPSANLSPVRRLDFSVGNSFFRNPWVIAPSTTTARDGLGPLFNTNACQNCHIKDGRGHPPEPGADNAVSMLVRLSIPDDPAFAEHIKQLGLIPEPVYGKQLQDMAIPGVTPEGQGSGRIRLNDRAFSATAPRCTCASLRCRSPNPATVRCTRRRELPRALLRR